MEQQIKAYAGPARRPTGTDGPPPRRGCLSLAADEARGREGDR